MCESIARFHRNRNLANGEQCRRRGPRRKDSYPSFLYWQSYATFFLHHWVSLRIPSLYKRFGSFRRGWNFGPFLVKPSDLIIIRRKKGVGGWEWKGEESGRRGMWKHAANLVIKWQHHLNIPDDSLNFQLHFVKLLTAHHVRQAKAKVHMSRKFRALDQLKSYCTKFPLLPLASILTRSFARLNNTTFTLSNPSTTVPIFHGLRPKQVTPPYGGG